MNIVTLGEIEAVLELANQEVQSIFEVARRDGDDDCQEQGDEYRRCGRGQGFDERKMNFLAANGLGPGQP